MNYQVATLKKLNHIKSIYLKKFGDDSLDRVILSDPFLNEAEAQETIKMLDEAITANKPLKQIDKEVWDKMIF